MFYGASRTGRFSGRLIQMQNLPQNHLPDLAEARALVRQGNLEAVKMLYEDVPDTYTHDGRALALPILHEIFGGWIIKNPTQQCTAEWVKKVAKRSSSRSQPSQGI